MIYNNTFVKEAKNDITICNMLIIGENGKDFDPFACLQCPVKDDCAMARVAGEIGAAIVEKGYDAEFAFGELVTDVVVNNEATMPTPLEIKLRIVELPTILDGITAYKSRIRADLTAALRIAAGHVDEFLGEPGADYENDVNFRTVDEMSYTAARRKILDSLNGKSSLLDETSVTTQDLISGVLALERHEPTGICGAVELRNDYEVEAKTQVSA